MQAHAVSGFVTPSADGSDSPTNDDNRDGFLTPSLSSGGVCVAENCVGGDGFLTASEEECASEHGAVAYHSNYKLVRRRNAELARHALQGKRRSNAKSVQTLKYPCFTKPAHEKAAKMIFDHVAVSSRQIARAPGADKNWIRNFSLVAARKTWMIEEREFNRLITAIKGTPNIRPIHFTLAGM
jgi:hypothetical protein